MYFRISITKLMNFQQLTVKHTIFPVLAGGNREEKKYQKVPGINLFCVERVRRGFLTENAMACW